MLSQNGAVSQIFQNGPLSHPVEIEQKREKLNEKKWPETGLNFEDDIKKGDGDFHRLYLKIVVDYCAM